MDFEVDKDFALLYGIMLGDGCLSLVNRKDRKAQTKFISITGSSIDDLPFFENIVHPLLKKFRGRDTKIKFRKDCKAIDYNFSDYKLFDIISSFGFPVGKKGDKLFIPKIFYDLNLVTYVISGFFATDGSLVLTKNPNKYYPRLEIHVISKGLLEEIFIYLKSLGLKGALYKCKRLTVSLGSYRNIHQKYRIQINGLQNLILFEKKIGFVNPKYKEKFMKFINYSQDYDTSIFGLASKLVKNVSIKKNELFISHMTPERF